METATATRPVTSSTGPAAGNSGAADSTVAGPTAHLRPPSAVNEPVLSYAPGTAERDEIKERLASMSSEVADIPVIIHGEEIRTGTVKDVVMPHDHGHVLANWHGAGDAEIERSIASARAAWLEWSAWSWQDRAAVFLRAADLLAGPWRSTINAATMLGQSKTVHQAEIDAAAEMVDFLRFNVEFASKIYEEQPISSPGMWNQLDHRPLEGFVYAITPFNFTSIAGNLPAAPALMGNVAIWKPAHAALLSAYYLQKMFEEAGLPPGVINFLPGEAREISAKLIASPDLSGIHFTGSTGVFQTLWKQVANNLENYRTYPRLVGETGGKDFIVAHRSARADSLAVAIVRGAFEYQGQKCSAASRIYVPDNLWPEVRDRVAGMLSEIRMGEPTDFRNFVAAVIDKPAFDSITEYIDHAKQSGAAEIIAGGEYSDKKGFFIEPTVVQANDPKYLTMCEEIFGPVVTIHVYPENEWQETLKLVDETSPYALTGAVFSTEREPIREAGSVLRFAAGNYYINDKPTGAVVGQQPFGGARASGTNDKAGSPLNLLRWVSPRTMKETFAPPTDYKYPYMEEA